MIICLYMFVSVTKYRLLMNAYLKRAKLNNDTYMVDYIYQDYIWELSVYYYEFRFVHFFTQNIW